MLLYQQVLLQLLACAQHAVNLHLFFQFIFIQLIKYKHLLVFLALQKMVILLIVVMNAQNVMINVQNAQTQLQIVLFAKKTTIKCLIKLVCKHAQLTIPTLRK